MHEHSPDAFASELSAALGDAVSFGFFDRGIHATDASHYQIMPRAVVVPRDEADVVASLRVAAAHGVPTTARRASVFFST